MWTLLAAMNGAEVGSLRRRLRREMTLGQIAEAQQRARAFSDQPSDQSSDEGPRAVTAKATGFLITSNGYLLTAHHAVANAGRIEVVHQWETYPATVIVKDEAIDVAVLRIEGAGFPCLALTSSAPVRTGDPVFTMGFPQVALQGMEPKFTEGSISSLSGPSGVSRLFQISVPIQAGNSGGPLVNQKGQVVGMVNARLNDLLAVTVSGMIPQNVNYAVKSSFILPFLESIEGVRLQAEAQGKSSQDRAEAIERTKQALVMVLCYR